MARVFGLDLESCGLCGGAMRVLAAIEDPVVICKILSHLRLATGPPAVAPSQIVQQAGFWKEDDFAQVYPE